MTEPNVTALRPATKNARHQQIVELVTHHEVHSQGELAALLADQGVHVTQATLSRDLDRARRGQGPRRPPAHSSTPCPARAATAARRRRGRPPPARPGSPGCAASCSSAPRPAPTWSCCAPRPAPPSSWPRPSTRPSCPTSSAPSPATTPCWSSAATPRGGDDLARRFLAMADHSDDTTTHRRKTHEQGPHHPARRASGSASPSPAASTPRSRSPGCATRAPSRAPTPPTSASTTSPTSPAYRPGPREYGAEIARAVDCRGPAGRGGPGRAGVRRLPRPLRRPRVLQHHAARPRRHRHHAGARHARGRRRHLGRRLDVQGQRHRAVLPLRAARQPRRCGSTSRGSTPTSCTSSAAAPR